MASRLDSLRGGGLDKLFPRDYDSKQPALLATTPWTMAGGRKNQQQYDQGLVRDALVNPERYHVSTLDVGHLGLRSTQPSVTRAGVQHYMSDDYRTHGTLFADSHKVANQKPLVYHREDGIDLLLSGHHRAAASLLSDTPIDAIHVHGPWGAKRG